MKRMMNRAMDRKMDRKIRLTAVLLAVLAMAWVLPSCSVFGRTSPPSVTEGEFPFLMEYEYDGSTYVIEDVAVCTYDGENPDSGVPRRTYVTELKQGNSMRVLTFAENTESALTEGQINVSSYLELYYGFGGYYLGDPLDEDRGPAFRYSETSLSPTGVRGTKVTHLTKEEAEEIFGIKILRFDFSEPIQNTFG